MKKVLVIVLVAALLLPLLAASITYAHDGNDHSAEWDSGHVFGQHQMNMREGMLGKDHNPGNHQGYSECVP